MLVRKMKAVLLYRPSAGPAAEKSCQPATRRLELGYNWPLVPHFDRPAITPTVVSLLFSLQDITGISRGWKRKLEDCPDQSFHPKKIFRLNDGSQTEDMIGHCWPLVEYKQETFLPQLLTGSRKRKSSEFHFVERKRLRLVPELMLTPDQDHSTTTTRRTNSTPMIAEMLLDLLFSHSTYFG